jgi:arylformamidase
MELKQLGRMIELSHRMVPGQEEFKLEIATFNTDEVMSRIKRRPDVWYILQEVTMSSHVGTHVELPYHHLKSGKSAAEYPLQRLVGEAVVLEFSHKKKDEEIQTREIVHTGVQIRPGDIVFIRTDMDKLWKTPKGHDRPCLSVEAARYLAQDCKISCLGTDATGLEIRGTDDQPVHQLLFAHDVALVESLRDLDQIRVERFLVFILPLPVQGLDSCPVRVVAFVQE